jgi:hypothetical protein
MYNELVAPFDVAKLDDFLVSYLFPDVEDGLATDDPIWSLDWPSSTRAMDFDNPLASDPFENVLQALMGFAQSLPPEHPDACPNGRLENAAVLFNKADADRFIRHYFRDYCPNSPILYPGTFQGSLTSTVLLTVMVIIGALFSSNADDAEHARGVLDLVEAYVFSNEKFTRLLGEPAVHKGVNDIEAWQALLAAFFITQIQLREGSLSKRKHARESRFEQVIHGVRALDLLETRNPVFHSGTPSPESFQWHQYGECESRIRLVCGIFNLDASFSILYNMVPRLFVEELSIDLAGPVDAFFAESAQDCYQVLLKESNNPTMTVSALCETFLLEEWDPQTESLMQNLSVLNMFTLVLALLQTLWLSPYRPRKADTMHRMRPALDRWKRIWDVQNTILTPQQRDRYGFLKAAPFELWQIAMVLVKKQVTRLDTAVDQNSIGQESAGGKLKNCNQRALAMLEQVDKEDI